jgi:hypothetical protein
MIYFNASICNPFWNKRFKNIWNRTWFISENKNLEIEFVRANGLIGFSITLAPTADHAGFEFSIDLFGYTFDFNFYDTRHWED